jgi:molybdopterin molybdotransferase
VARERIGDDPEKIKRAVARALEMSDLIVVIGGASVGEKDFAKSALGELGLELIFSKVAIKPGKPVWAGRLGSKLVMGLPGNPTSAMVTGRLLLAPLIAGLSGQSPNQAALWRSVALSEALAPCGDRETFVRGRRIGSTVQPLSNQDSSVQRVLGDADLLIRRRAGAPALAAAELVEVIDF